MRTERSLLDGAPDFRMVLATALDIATGLEYLHAANILHGDLTCNNAMLQGCSTDPRGFVAKVPASHSISKSVHFSAWKPAESKVPASACISLWTSLGHRVCKRPEVTRGWAYHCALAFCGLSQAEACLKQECNTFTPPCH